MLMDKSLPKNDSTSYLEENILAIEEENKRINRIMAIKMNITSEDIDTSTTRPVVRFGSNWNNPNIISNVEDYNQA